METKEMKQYTGTKTVKAMPMTLGEAEQVLRRAIDQPAVENRNQVPGYLVEYCEDGDRYRSWSPKEVFERAYRPSSTYIDRMTIEYDQLKERILKLQTRILDISIGSTYEERMVDLPMLHDQLRYMQRYAKTLAARINQAVEKEKKDAEFEKLVAETCKGKTPYEPNTQDLTGGGPRPVHNQDDDDEPQPFC